MNNEALIFTGLIISVPLWLMGLGMISLAESARRNKQNKD